MNNDKEASLLLIDQCPAYWLKIPLKARFVPVPISVPVPPMFEAYANNETEIIQTLL